VEPRRHQDLLAVPLLRPSAAPGGGGVILWKESAHTVKSTGCHHREVSPLHQYYDSMISGRFKVAGAPDPQRPWSARMRRSWGWRPASSPSWRARATACPCAPQPSRSLDRGVQTGRARARKTVRTPSSVCAYLRRETTLNLRRRPQGDVRAAPRRGWGGARRPGQTVDAAAARAGDHRLRFRAQAPASCRRHTPGDSKRWNLSQNHHPTICYNWPFARFIFLLKNEVHEGGEASGVSPVFPPTTMNEAAPCAQARAGGPRVAFVPPHDGPPAGRPLCPNRTPAPPPCHPSATTQPNTASIPAHVENLSPLAFTPPKIFRSFFEFQPLVCVC